MDRSPPGSVDDFLKRIDDKVQKWKKKTERKQRSSSVTSSPPGPMGSVNFEESQEVDAREIYEEIGVLKESRKKKSPTLCVKANNIR